VSPERVAEVGFSAAGMSPDGEEFYAIGPSHSLHGPFPRYPVQAGERVFLRDFYFDWSRSFGLNSYAIFLIKYPTRCAKLVALAVKFQAFPVTVSGEKLLA
jgi:hypothetical protein